VATLATRADLDRPRGSQEIDDLLREAFAASDSQVDKDAKAQARLDASLEDADAAIRRYLDASEEWDQYPETDLRNIRPIARDLAILFLRQQTAAGRSDEKIQAQKDELVKQLKDMRERKTWTGTTLFHAPTTAEFVESASAFSRSRTTGMT
jgi:hypothetical protein